MLLSGEKFQEVWNPILLGTVYGLIGKVKILPGKSSSTTKTIFVNLWILQSF